MLRRLPSSGSSDRRLVCEVCSSNARNLPLGCHEAGICAFLLSVSRCNVARPVGPLPIQVESNCRRARANTMRRPSGVHTGFAVGGGVERQTRQRVARPVVNPDVVCLPSRCPWRAVGHRVRSGDSNQFAGAARIGIVFPSRSIHWMGMSAASILCSRQIHQRAAVRHRKFRRAGAHVDGDAFDGGHRLARHR